VGRDDHSRNAVAGRDERLIELQSRHAEHSHVGDQTGRARAITITATITAFDVVRGTVTLTGPQGRSRTFKAQRPADLERIRAGDLADITYSEALALSARPVVKP